MRYLAICAWLVFPASVSARQGRMEFKHIRGVILNVQWGTAKAPSRYRKESRA
jgi:hypothetical protein